jgi:hypothetical protein
VLDKCHNPGNQVEYEGILELPRQLLEELIDITKELLVQVEAPGSVRQILVETCFQGRVNTARN